MFKNKGIAKKSLFYLPRNPLIPYSVPMKMTRYSFLSFVVMAVMLALSACSSLPRMDGNHYETQSFESKSNSAPYYYVQKPIQCVPFARDVSGINIFGNAHTWWEKASHGYLKGSKPELGAVLVLKKTGKLPHGHVAVVSKIISPRVIEVTHSNWGHNTQTRRMVHRAMRVKDVSANNDWSNVRFWNYPSASFGFPYASYGFIYPNGRAAFSHPQG